MASKKDLCKECKYFDCKNQICTNDNKKEIIIINRKETIAPFVPNKETKCDYFEGVI